MTVMGDAGMDRLSDAGSIPARSTSKKPPAIGSIINSGWFLLPRHLQLLILFCAVGKIQIDKSLVWYAGIFALQFEKVNRITVNINSNLFHVRFINFIPIVSIYLFRVPLHRVSDARASNNSTKGVL